MTFISNQLVPELSVSDFKRSLAFYTEILGFSVPINAKKKDSPF